MYDKDGKILPGTRLKTLFGGMITVEKFLAQGGQGGVYIVDVNGEKKALKWYHKYGLGENPTAFYENIKQNVMRGAPSNEFLWPQDITEWVDGTFGYVMDLRPAGYYEVTEFMLKHVGFKSFKKVIDAALQIVSAYRILHNAGYSYLDLNDGNFFINPETGKVLICDNDNVAPDNTETGIKGKPRYMAPEIVLGKNKPNSLSDRFSMSIILYILFCLNHPLEGKKYLTPGLTEEMKKDLYGAHPVFMMDPNDDSNGPHPEAHKNSVIVWNALPDYMREIFTNSFSQKSISKPSARPREIDWLNVLTRFRSEIIASPTGGEIFTENGRLKASDKGKVDVPFRLELQDYSIPAVKGSRIYRCQLGVCNEKEALDPVADILVRKDTGALGIRNKTKKRWDAVSSKGEPKKVAVDGVVPLKDGIKLIIDGETVTIRKN